MRVTKAIITAAGLSQRRLPLQTVVGRDGYPRPVLSALVEEVAAAGIEEVAVVTVPGDERLYAEALERAPVRVQFVAQDKPRGDGHAVWCARQFAANAPVIVMMSDHLYVSRDPSRSCARQLVEIAEAERCSVSAVQPTHESQIGRFGTVGGRLFDGRPGLFLVERVTEKPTPTVAEQNLIVPGLRLGHYLCFFGMHVITSSVFAMLDAMVQDAPDDGRVRLAEALGRSLTRERYLAAQLAGQRFDLGERYGLLFAQLALALESERRSDVLAALVSLLAARQ
jgi:UTP--glucose-1-phosphate uridylyltransferase